MNQQKDMGVGSIKKHMLAMALPAVSAQLVNMLYNIVDLSIAYLLDISRKLAVLLLRALVFSPQSLC